MPCIATAKQGRSWRCPRNNRAKGDETRPGGPRAWSQNWKKDVKKIIFLAGPPAAGKSTVRLARWADMPVVDPDLIKERIPGYDPKRPEGVHKASKRLAREQFTRLIEEGVSFVYDTTSSNVGRVRREIEEARQAGYRIVLCLVWAPLSTCLARNRQRPRTVPEEVVVSIWHEVEAAWREISPLGDEVLKVING